MYWHSPDATHVIPLFDQIEHEWVDCVCGPDAELQPNGTWLICHHSLDGREMLELRKPQLP